MKVVGVCSLPLSAQTHTHTKYSNYGSGVHRGTETKTAKSTKQRTQRQTHAKRGINMHIECNRSKRSETKCPVTNLRMMTDVEKNQILRK